MYPDLFKRLNLKPEDLEKYDSPLVGFDGRLVTSCRMIRLPVQAGDEEVQVDFIVVEVFSPYIAYPGQTMASCYGSSLINPTLES